MDYDFFDEFKQTDQNNLIVAVQGQAVINYFSANACMRK